MHRKHFYLAILGCLLVALGVFAVRGFKYQSSPTPNKRFNVAITQIVEHPSLDSVRRGLTDYLNENGFKDKLTLEYQNALGNMITNTQIAKKLLAKRPEIDAIVAIGTPPAQAVLNKNTSIPVLFSPISDPLGAKLIKDWQHPGGIATGTSDRAPVRRLLELIKALLPEVTSVAILFNPSESNSLDLVQQFKQACKELDLTPIEGPVLNTAMVYATASAIRADAIYVPTDNTVVSAVEAAIKAGVTTKTPVFAGEGDSVAKGALAALSVDYYALGRETGDMLVSVLEKKGKPEAMPVRFQKTFDLHINQRHAERMGVHFPKALLAKAILHR